MLKELTVKVVYLKFIDITVLLDSFRDIFGSLGIHKDDKQNHLTIL